MRSRTLLTLLLALLLASNLPYSSAAGEAKAPHLSLPQGVSTLQLPEGQGLAYSPGDLAYAEAFRTQLKGDTIIVVTGSEGLRLSGGVDDGALRAKATLPRGCEDLEPMVHAYLGRVSIGEIAMGYTRVSCGGGMAEVLVDLDGVLALAHPDPGELMTITITLAPGAALLIIAFQPAPEPSEGGAQGGEPPVDPGVTAREGRDSGLPLGLGSLAILALALSAAILGAILEGVHPRLRGGCP